MGNGWTSQYIESRIKFLLVYVMHWTWYRYVDNNNSHAYSKESGSQNIQINFMNFVGIAT